MKQFRKLLSLATIVAILSVCVYFLFVKQFILYIVFALIGAANCVIFAVDNIMIDEPR